MLIVLISAWNTTGEDAPVVVFLVQEGERNRMDQRMI